MTLKQFLSGVSNMVHNLFTEGNLFGGILWLVVLYGFYRGGRYLSEEKLKSPVAKMIFLGILLAFMDHGIYDNQVNLFLMASIAFIGAGKGVYDQVVGEYAPSQSLTSDGVKTAFLVAIASLVFLFVYHAIFQTRAPTDKSSESSDTTTPAAPTLPKPSDAPRPVSPSETEQAETVRIPPNTTLTVARQALNVREAPCSNSPQLTYTDGTPIVLAQNDTVKTLDEPLAYCEKGNRRYPWVRVEFAFASGIKIMNDARGWVSLCELNVEKSISEWYRTCTNNLMK